MINSYETYERQVQTIDFSVRLCRNWNELYCVDGSVHSLHPLKAPHMWRINKEINLQSPQPYLTCWSLHAIVFVMVYLLSVHMGYAKSPLGFFMYWQTM